MKAERLADKLLPKRVWWPARWLVPMVCLPLLVGLIAVTAFGYREWQAARMLPYELSDSALPEQTTSADAWLDASFRQSTSTVATAQWSEIFFLTTYGSWYRNAADELPVVGSAPLPELFEPRQAWPLNARVEEYLQDRQLLIERIHEAAELPTPVWQPLQFQGIATLLHTLENVRYPFKLIQLEAEYSVVNADDQRALTAITSLQAIADSINWKPIVVARSVAGGLRYSYLQTIQRSLQTSLWNAEQLRILMQQISQPIAVRESFQQSVRGQKAMMASLLESNASLFVGMRLLKFPNGKLKLLDRYDEALALTDVPGVRLSRRLAAMEEDSSLGSDNLLEYHLFHNFSSYATQFENAEQARQQTLVALAIKLFTLEYNRLPATLAELSQVGLSDRDWTIVGVGPLDYEIRGSRAYVWSRGDGERLLAPQLPPLENDEFGDGQRRTVITFDAPPS